MIVHLDNCRRCRYGKPWRSLCVATPQMTLHRVVVGMDFSEPSVVAARWVIQNVAPGAEVVLAHAIELAEPPPFLRDLYPPSDATIKAGRTRADRLLRDLSRSLKTDRLSDEVRVGRPEDTLTAVARDRGASLIVTAVHGERSELWRVLGSTAERVVRRTPVSVLLIRGLCDHPPQKVLVALDESDLLPALIAWASHFVDTIGATVTVIHIAPPITHTRGPDSPAELPKGPSEAELHRRVDDWMATQLANTPLASAQRMIAFGEPGFELEEAVRRSGADLLIIGRHGRARDDRSFVGSTAEFEIRNAKGPVLIVAEPPH